MLFSVVIVTRNRAGIIGKALDSLEQQSFSKQRFEVIVVDNGSTDKTCEAIESFKAVYSFKLELQSEPVKGICRARNTGWQRASGSWVVYLDDDAVAHEQWLAAYAAAIDDYPGAKVFGGPGILDKGLHRPWWWCSKFDWTMSCSSFGTQAGDYPPGQHPFGLNMAIQKEWLAVNDGFDTMLDDTISSFADETEFFIRSAQKKARLVYVPRAVVVHNVSQDRLMLAPFIQRCALVGRSYALLDSMHGRRYVKPLLRRLLTACLGLVRYRTPALFIQEWCEWRGYREYSARLRNRHA